MSQQRHKFGFELGKHLLWSWSFWAATTSTDNKPHVYIEGADGAEWEVCPLPVLATLPAYIWWVFWYLIFSILFATGGLRDYEHWGLQNWKVKGYEKDGEHSDTEILKGKLLSLGTIL